MAWVRIHDGATTNLKIVSLTDSAFRLWVKGLSYCQVNLTDGLIPAAALRDMAAKRKDIDALTMSVLPDRSPLWESVDGFGFKVHDYLDWNDSREIVLKRQWKAKDRKEKWNAGRNAGRNGVPERVPHGDPNGEPNLTKPKKEQEHEIAREGFDRLWSEFWEAYPRKVGKEPALKSFRALKPDAALVERMIQAISRQKRSPQWLRDSGQFIPHPRTWLYQRRWEDQVEAVGSVLKMDTAPYEEFRCPHSPECHGRSACALRSELDAMKAEATPV